MVRRLLLLSLLLVGGCAWPVRQTTDQTVREMVEHPFDVAPEAEAEPAKTESGGDTGGEAAAISRTGETPAQVPDIPNAEHTAARMEPRRDAIRHNQPIRDDQILTVSWTQPQTGPNNREATQRKLDLNIPPRVPGSEAPRIVLPQESRAADARNRPPLSGASSPAGRAEGAARAGRKALHLVGLSAPGRRQQSDHRPGGSGCRSRQGHPDPGQDLPQSHIHLCESTG